jgi:tetratricopeptide (TPR) repeat protein
VDADGYPTKYVDQTALRALLAARRFTELTTYVETLQSEFEADPKREAWPSDAGDAFDTADPELLPLLDAWAASAPASFAPLFARGNYWVTVAYARRGSKWARDTPTSDLAAMDDAAARAWKDLEQAIAIRPKLVAARTTEMTMLRAFTQKQTFAQTFDAAVATCATCFLPRVQRMIALVPRWGGSFAAMDAFARESITVANTRMRVLGGYVDYERARELREKNDLAEALAAIERALAVGDDSLFFEERARIHSLRNEAAPALADLDRAVSLRPGYPSLRADRARAHLLLQHWEDAGRDLLAALRVDSTNEAGRALMPGTVKALVYASSEARRAGHDDEAARTFALALDFGRSDFDVNKAIDDELAREGRFDRVVALWTDYLASHPNDGRAYLERGGAYFNLRRAKEAYDDATKACDLGVAEGCARAKKVAPMVK